jgi:hypothetical protein
MESPRETGREAGAALDAEAGPAVDAEAFTAAKEKALKHAEVRGWFFGAPIESIRRGNLEEWVAWAFHNTLPTLLSEREYKSMQQMVDQCSEWAQIPLPYGEKNPDVKCMRLTLDPVPSLHRPLVFYGVVAGNRPTIHSLYTHYVLRGGGRGPADCSVGADEVIRLQELQLWHPTVLALLDQEEVGGDRQVGNEGVLRVLRACTHHPLHRQHKEDELLPLVFCHGLGTVLIVCTVFIVCVNSLYS